MESTHDFFDRRLIIPPVNIQNVNIGSAKIVQTRFYRVANGFDIILCVANLLFDIIVPVLTRRRILPVHMKGMIIMKRCLHSLILTFVAITIWSRMPRSSSHSPIICSLLIMTTQHNKNTMDTIAGYARLTSY
jgi:hypothetical protein